MKWFYNSWKGFNFHKCNFDFLGLSIWIIGTFVGDITEENTFYEYEIGIYIHTKYGIKWIIKSKLL